MTDLVVWLRQQIDEDELAWEMVAARDVVEMLHGEPLAPRMLAEVVAKRAILELHAITVTKVATAPFDPDTGERREPEYEVECTVCGWVSDDPTSGCETIRLLAQPFAGRPGWREEWRF